MTSKLSKTSNTNIKSASGAEKPKNNSITVKIEDFLKFSGDYKFLESVLNFISEPIAIKNSKGEYLAINKAMEELFGYVNEQVVGKSILKVRQKKFEEEIYKADASVLNTGISSTLETTFYKQDGEMLNLMVTKHRINLSVNNEPGILTIATDITNIKKAEDIINIQYTIDYLETLNKGLKRTLESILEQLFKLHWVDCAGIYLYYIHNKKLRLICHKGISKEFVNHVKSFDEHSNEFKMIARKETIYIKTSDLPKLARQRDEKEGILFSSVIPLFNHDTKELIGNMNLASKKQEEILEEDKRVVESIARRIVNLIIYAQGQKKFKDYRLNLEQKIEEKTTDLSNKIKELEAADEKLSRSEKKYRNLQDNIPIGVYTNNIEGKFLHVNIRVVQMFRYDSIQEMMSVPLNNIYLNLADRSMVIAQLSNTGKINKAEIQFVRKDGSVFWGSISVRAVFDDHGKPIQFDGIIEDITDLINTRTELEEANKKITSINKSLEKRIEEALSKQEEQNSLLIQKSKLESLGELSAGIAHEINQPLGVMALTFENLKIKINSKKLTPLYLETKFQSIEDNIKRIRDIIDHIRTFSRDQESFVLDKVNINKVIRKALSMIGVQYRNHNINIKLDLNEEIGFTVGSNLKVEQVILNLLSNSKYALEEKGTIVSEAEFSKEILIKTDSTEHRIILMVEDNGIGIKAKHLARIFDPFFTTKPEGFGTGLGLSIVYGLVKDMRGEILVNSMENKFTKFKITYPRFPEKA